MRCTECSTEVLPIVAIDIDGTLGKFHQHFWDFLRMYLGVPVPDQTDAYRGVGPFKEWAMKAYQIDERTWYDIKLAYRQGAQKRTMPVYKDARGLCHYVKKFPAELWLVTARPFNRLDNVDPDTREWLHRHHLRFDYLIADDDKYSLLRERVDPERVVAVLDDLPEMYDSAESIFGPHVPILRKSEFNRDVSRTFQAYDLYQGLAQIRQRLALWKRRERDKTDIVDPKDMETLLTAGVDP